MTNFGKLAVELAEARVDRERDVLVLRAQQRLPSGPGTASCQCGAIIPEARRQALPGATDCIDCAREREARSDR